MSQAETGILQQFRDLIRRIKSYEEAVGVLYWDLRTGAPRKGVEQRSEVIGELSTEMFRMSISPEMKGYLDELSVPEVLGRLDEVDRKLVEESRKEYERSSRIPPEKYQAYVVLTSQAESVWEDTKPKNDWDTFRPYLEKIVAMTREFVQLWGYEGHPYNTLLDMYEPGMTVEKLDQVFGELRERTVPLVAEIAKSDNRPDRSFLSGTFDPVKQKKFGLRILQDMGYDFEAGRLDESAHPFATGLNPGDVRITTRYLPNDVTSALFGIIHEGGHALYEQNLSSRLTGTTLSTGTSMGIHESQSRFWENMIGRSRGFWQRYFGELQKQYAEQFGDVSAEEFYRAINEVQPSLIRIEADELTYNLHIIIRYELEKALFGGELEVGDLPEVWRRKYREYLGVEPGAVGEGVMQDIHWSGGSFGYFPSYALGNMYAAQFAHTLRKELPTYDSLVETGDLLPIKDWLTEKIYQYGKLYTPSELVERITGEPLNPAYLMEYFEEKYRDIYRL
jgi:carboxypeptidase Taq